MLYHNTTGMSHLKEKENFKVVHVRDFVPWTSKSSKEIKYELDQGKFYLGIQTN
jgi:hypothetical protein